MFPHPIEVTQNQASHYLCLLPLLTKLVLLTMPSSCLSSAKCRSSSPTAGCGLYQYNVELQVAIPAHIHPIHPYPISDNPFFPACCLLTPQSIRLCASPLAPTESIHCLCPDSSQSSSRPPPVLQANSVFVFLNERPEFISCYGSSLHLLDFGVMNHLCFVTSIKGQERRQCHKPVH